MRNEILLLIIAFLPLLGAFLISVSGRLKIVRDFFITSIPFAFLITFMAFFDQLITTEKSNLFFEIIPGLELFFSLDSLGLIFLGLISLLWPIATIYSIGYLKKNEEKNQTRFHSFFAFSISGAVCVALSGNLLTLFIAYEVLTLSTYPLVAHKDNEKSRNGSRTYLTVLLLTSIGIFLPAIIWIYQITGTLTFTQGGIFSNAAVDEPILIALILMIIFGVGKAAVMPFHKWLPAAMVAPTPVSALLHAVAVVKAGVFSIAKIFIFIFGVDLIANINLIDWIFGISAATIIIASLIALRQNNLKRLLAYSTISQLSYVIFGVLILAPLSIVGALLHIISHAFGKITLFFAAGSIYSMSKKTQVSELRGIGRLMPWTMGSFSIAALSMIGVPPLAGFLSKWYFLLGAWQAEHYLAMAVIIISTLLNTAYFFPILYVAWFCRPEKNSNFGEAPLSIVLSLVFTALLTASLFVWVDFPLEQIFLVTGKPS